MHSELACESVITKCYEYEQESSITGTHFMSNFQPPRTQQKTFKLDFFYQSSSKSNEKECELFLVY